MTTSRSPAREEALALDGGVPALPRFLPFGAPTLDEEEIAEVVDTLRSGWIGTGPKTAALERAFAAYVGARHSLIRGERVP